VLHAEHRGAEAQREQPLDHLLVRRDEGDERVTDEREQQRREEIAKRRRA
jgi:hypothetical protein